MSKLMNNKSLLIIFGLLLATLLIVSLVDSKKGERTFMNELPAIELSNVSELIIHSKDDFKTPITLFKSKENWMVSKNAKTHQADQNTVSNMIGELNRLKINRLAANKEMHWSKYEVSDSLGTRVIIKGDKEALLDIYIGKFSYQQAPTSGQHNPYQAQQGKMTTYIRLNNETEVYAVNGFLSATFNRNFDQFRDKTIIKSDPSNWTKVEVKHPGDSSFVLEKINNHWTINSEICDSLSASQYLKNLGTVNGNSYLATPVFDAIHELKIEGTGMSTPIIIKSGVFNEKQAIESNLNNGNTFDGSKNDLFLKIFGNRPKVKK